MPLLISIPHGGWIVPPEVEPFCRLTKQEVDEDGDGGATEIYRPLGAHVLNMVTTDVARAILDMNRASDDRRQDGVIKTHTCWNVPVYDPALPEEIAARLIKEHHQPYHARLTELAGGDHILGVDCHTMAAHGPPVGPDPGSERPAVCISNADGTCPDEWLEELQRCFQAAFEQPVKINEPFKGGHIVRSHSSEMPWVQVELSRAEYATLTQKSHRVLAALMAWCDLHRT